jgi:predicted transcriptional regulator
MESTRSLEKQQPVYAFRLDQVGLARFFGRREAQIVEAVWQLKEAAVQDVCDWLGDVNYKTILTVMTRLARKGVLVCNRQGRAFVYQPVADRETFLSEVFHRLAYGLLDDFGNLALDQIVETASEVDLALLDELERLIRQKRLGVTQSRGG